MYLEGDAVGDVDIGLDQPVSCYVVHMPKLVASRGIQGVQGTLFAARKRMRGAGEQRSAKQLVVDAFRESP